MKPKETFKKRIKTIILTFIILFLISIIIYNKHIFVNYLIFYFIPAFFIYQERKSKKIFYTLFFYGLEALIVAVDKFILFLLIDEGIINELAMTIILCFLAIFLIILVQFILFKFFKTQSIRELWKIKLYRIGLFSILAAIYAALAVPWVIQKKSIIINKYIPKVTLGFLFFTVALITSLYFLFIFNFYRTLLAEKSKEQSIEIRMLKQSLRDRKVLNEEKVKLIHDIKNHNIVMSLLIKKGQYEELQNYIDQFNEEINQITNKEITANLILNNILKVKRDKALKKGIDFKVDCRVLREVPINSFDITTLFGNLIDNAIEENERIKGENKFININIWENEWILFFAIENLSSEEKFDNNKPNEFLKTKKVDKKNHGLGIKNVNRIIKKYDGVIKFEKEKNIFMASGYINKIDEKV